jgi:hypothetical protein
MRNTFWLASCFSKIKKLNSHFLENQRGIAGVCIFDTTPASMRATQVSLIIITMSLPDKQSSYMEPSSSIGRTQSSLAASFVMPSPKKTDGKADQAVDDEPYINKRKPSSMTAAKDDSNNGPSPKKTDGNGNQVVDYKPFVDKRKPSSMTAVKVN